MQRLSKLFGGPLSMPFQGLEESTVDGFGPPAAKHGMWLTERPRLISDSAPAGMRTFGHQGAQSRQMHPRRMVCSGRGLARCLGFSEFYLNSQSYLWVRPFISQKPDRLKLI